MSINVNKITSVLAKLQDFELQQYAQMHKNDPYIMSLAVHESNRRKDVRNAEQGAMQEQPKVADQMLAEMAPRPAQPMPEDQGIGQLNAGEMNFAGGGIIAFADGGDVERYSGEFGSFVDGVSPEFGFSPAYMPDTAPDPASMRRVSASPYVAPPAVSGETAELLKRFPPPSSTSRAAPAAPREERAPAAGGAPAPSGLGGIDALQQKYFGNFDEKQSEFRGMREGLVQGIKDLTASNLADVEADAAARSSDVVFKGREQRLAKQEKDIAGMPDRYLGLALLQAGAAMMSTPGGLAAAIGKGAVVGADRYAAGLEKINAAQAKFAEARDRLDDLRLNRDDMNAKQILTAKREYKAADLKGKELLLSGAEKDWGIERDVLGKLFTAAKEDLRTDKTIKAQKEIAGMKGGQDRIKDEVFQKLLVDNGNDPVKAMTAFNKLMAKPEDLEAYYKKQQLDKLAEAKVKLAGMPGAGIPGQQEKLDALERQLMGNQVKVASRADVAATAKSSGKTEQQVTEALRARGYTIQ
jgi:hypothetical protein